MDDRAEFVVNAKLMKKCGYYQMFVPNTGGGGVNVYRTAFVLLTLAEQVPLFYGNSGLFVGTPYVISSVEALQVAYGNIQYALTTWSAAVLLYNRDAVWRLFDVAAADFLRSGRCRARAAAVLRRRRAGFVLFTDLYYALSWAVIVQWVTFPLAYNRFAAAAAQDVRLLNVINLPFPVTADTYNRHFWAIYAVEMFMSVFLIYAMILVDVMLLSFGWVIVAQYEVLARAFGDLANDGGDGGGVGVTSDYDDLLSVICDQQRLYSKFRLFFSIVKPILLVYVAITSSTIVIMTFTFVLMFSSPELFSILSAVKVASTVLYLCLQLYLYCYLFDTMNIRREAVNSAVYSCDWTRADLKFKKSLLLTMQINNAERFVLKATQKKIINLQFFANVISTCYNIVSVVAKSMNRDGQQTSE